MRLFIRKKFNTKYLILGNRKFKFFRITFPCNLFYENGREELSTIKNNIKNLGIKCSSIEEARELSSLCMELGFSRVIVGSFENDRENKIYYSPNRVNPHVIRTSVLFTFSFVQDLEHFTRFFEFIRRSGELGYKTCYQVKEINGYIIK